MDRSFLSQPEVIRAAGSFVCIRLTTYEDRDEANVLKSIFVGRSRDVENTTFAILAPDGKEQLVRPGRSPDWEFRDAKNMAEGMTRIARKYDGKKTAGEPELPALGDVRLALDVAACENLPLVCLCAQQEDQLRQLEGRVRKLAWSDEFQGRAIFATAKDKEQLKAIEGSGAGLLVIQPDRYGVKGKVIAQNTVDASPNDLARTLRAGIDLHRPVERTFQEHVRAGRREGIFWETKIPVTDPMERRAREGKSMPPPPPGRRGPPPGRGDFPPPGRGDPPPRPSEREK
jgi:hypothetical protein